MKSLRALPPASTNGDELFTDDAESLLVEVRRLREPRELFVACPACSCDQLEFDPATNQVVCTACDYDVIENRELAVTAERRKHDTTLENLRSCNRYAAHLERELHALDGRPIRFADLVEAQDAGELVLPNRPPGSPPRPAGAPTALRWTREPPTRQGWYWVKYADDSPDEASVIHVAQRNGVTGEEREDGYIKAFEYDEYSGPLTPPEDT